MCPFIVDPSSRALNWLKTHLKDQRLEVINQQSPNFNTSLELAVRFGKCLIIQEVDEVEPVLFPILSGNLVATGSRYTIMLGEKIVDYHQDFRLFLCTRETPRSIGSVHPASAGSLVTVVNFATTRAGLVNQLLETSLQHERPELETRRQELVRCEESMKLELAKLEDDLLEELANAHGNILENKDLLQSLNKTKQSSMTVASSLTESLRLQIELDQERNVFHPLAETGSRLYFALTDLVKINQMYQFSLNSFLHLFQRALSMPQNTGLKTSEHIKSLQKRLETFVYENVSRSLFKADRLMFTLHMVQAMRPELISEEEWAFFIGLNINETRPNTDLKSNWLDPERARNLTNLKATLPQIYSNLHLDDPKVWMNWINQNEVENVPIPSVLQSNPLTSFQTSVLLIQALRPDRLQTALTQFACRALDLREISPPSLNLYRLFETETRANEPILLLISPGADPSQELIDAAKYRFANKLTNSELGTRYRQVAMGQGQSDLALNELRSAAQCGDWLCLKNLHLVTHWLPTLEKEINNLLLNSNVISKETHDGNQSTQVHEDFRLWLTAEPRTNFPSTLLQACLKVAYEAPPGLKRNLRRTYENWSRSYIAQSNSKTRATTLACLAWFHAVTQERRTYIPQGWSKFYEFSFADLRAGADIIDRLLIDRGNTGIIKDIWAWIHGLFSESIYGGRMDNEFDLRVLNSYLKQIFSDETMRNLKLGPFTIPGTTELKDYTLQIDALPDYDLPSFFNLPENIDRSTQRNEANRVISQLRLINRVVGPVHKFDKTVWNQELGPMLNLWKKLNHGLQLIQTRLPTQSTNVDKESRNNNIKSGYGIDTKENLPNEKPIIEFLYLEFYNALHLVHTVHSGLAGLSRACRGTQLVTNSLYRLATSLLHGETPNNWLAEWPEGPDEPVLFLRGLIVKASAIQKWFDRAKSGALFTNAPLALDLADLFRPSTFLNALRQQTARQLNIAIDKLKLSSVWPGRINSQLTEYKSGQNEIMSINIQNLKLEGANFENGQLVKSNPESPSFIQLPDVRLKWISKDDPDPVNPNESILLPVYFDNKRENLVTQLQVPCPPGSQEQWIQAGTALLLSSL